MEEHVVTYEEKLRHFLQVSVFICVHLWLSCGPGLSQRRYGASNSGSTLRTGFSQSKAE